MEFLYYLFNYNNHIQFRHGKLSKLLNIVAVSFGKSRNLPENRDAIRYYALVHFEPNVRQCIGDVVGDNCECHGNTPRKTRQQVRK